MVSFSSQDVFAHRDLASPTGDGAHHTAVFTVSRAQARNDRYRTRLWRLDSTGEPGPVGPRTLDVSSPQLSSDGGRVAFLGSQKAGGKRAYVMALADGEPTALAETEGTVQALLQWQGGFVLAQESSAWIEEGQDADFAGKKPPRVINHLPWKLDGSGAIVGRRVRLTAIPIDGGPAQVRVAGDFDVTAAALSPDGQRLAWLRSDDGQQRHRPQLWLADADGNNAHRVPCELPSLQGLRWSPDGRYLALAGSRREGDSIHRLWLYEPGSNTWRCPWPTLEMEGTQMVWHADGQRLATVASRRGLFQVAVGEIHSHSWQALPLGLSQVTGLSAHGDRLLVVVDSLRQGRHLQSLDWQGANETVHGHFNRWYRARLRPEVTKQQFQVPNGDVGQEYVDAWVMRPTDRPPPYPLLVDMHGGPQSVALLDFAAHVYRLELVARGWMVVMPNTVGSGGYGADFARRLRGYWGELDLPQHEAIIETLQAQGLADERVACTGKSYGGYLSAWAVGQSLLFRAAVVCAPVANIQSHAGTSDTGYYVTPYAMDGELPSRRHVGELLSPVNHCHGSNVATLVLQGQEDGRCPAGQSEELFAGLVRCARGPARMVMYPGEGHALSGSGKPLNRVDYHRRLAAWVVEHVDPGSGNGGAAA